MTTILLLAKSFPYPRTVCSATVDGQTITFGPGRVEHTWTELRGARTVYLKDLLPQSTIICVSKNSNDHWLLECEHKPRKTKRGCFCIPVEKLLFNSFYPAAGAVLAPASISLKNNKIGLAT